MNAKLNSGQISRSLFEFEISNFDKISSMQFDSWIIWPLIRFNLYYKILNDLSQSESKINQKRTKIQIFDILKFLKSFFKIFFKKKRKFIVFPYDFEKIYVDEKNQRVNVTFDEIVNIVGRENVLYIERSTNGGFWENSKFNYDLNEDIIRSIIFVLNKSLRFFKLFKSNSILLEDSLALFYKERFLYSNSIFNNFIEYIYYQFAAEYYVYKLIFLILRPKCIITSDQFATGKMAAARKKKIKIYELQHGFIEEFKPDYIISNQLKKVKKHIAIPDAILVYGQFYKDIIMNYGFWDSKEIIAIGKFRLSEMKNRIVEKNDKKRIKILFPTQWTKIEDSKNILKHLAKTEIGRNFELKIKLHPVESEKNVKWYLGFCNTYQNFLLLPSNSDIYDEICKADLILGYDSASLIESISLSKPVISIVDKLSKTSILSSLSKDIIGKYLKTSVIEVTDVIALDRILYLFLFNDIFKQNWVKEVCRNANFLYSKDYANNIKNLFYSV